MPDTIKLGYEVGTGKTIHIPVAHTLICGVTQKSGKTTALQALVDRSENRYAVAFITKRAESAFHDARKIQPYFTENSDWQFVESLLEATMRQKMKFERAWIIRVTKGTHSLEEVQRNIQT